MTKLDFDLELKSDEWKVYQAEIDGISMIGNERAQFDRVIKNRGFDALMSELRRKQRELADLLCDLRESS